MDNYAFNIVKKLSFNRVAGTAEEKKAASIIQEEIEKLGGQSELLPFDMDYYKCNHCSAKALEKDLDVVCFGRSGNINRDLKFLYLDAVNDITTRHYKDLSDTCVLLNSFNKKVYQKLLALHAGAFMVISGKWYYGNDEEDLVPRKLRGNLEALGRIPGFVIRAKDALYLLQNDCETIHLEMDTEDLTLTSQDVLSVIEGTEYPEESIMILGHYDSVPVGTGAWDNATGSATLLDMYRHFLKNPPKRTLRFVWCGAEEQGLLGSKKYVEVNEELLPQIKFVFNFDMNGAVFGPNLSFVTGNKDLENYYDALCKEYGYYTEVRVGVQSSDSAYFAKHGIPALGIGRGNRQIASFHTRYDVIDLLSPREMQKNLDFSRFCIERVANSAVMPIPTGFGEEMQKKVDEIFFYKE